jgi:hypothetical protein
MFSQWRANDSKKAFGVDPPDKDMVILLLPVFKVLFIQW